MVILEAWAASWQMDPMCNEQRRRIALGQLREDWQQTRIPLVFPEGLPNMEPLDSIRITDMNVIIRKSADGDAEAVTRRWSWPAPNGKPVYNFRSEGRALESGRCLIVADGFYEFTEPAPAPGQPKKRRKDKWLFTSATADWFCIAGFWRRTAEVGEAYTMLTVAPGPDIAPYHDRQVVVLTAGDWAGWLDPLIPARDILKPSPAGSLRIEWVG